MAEASSSKKELPRRYDLAGIFIVSALLGGVVGQILGDTVLGLVAGFLLAALILLTSNTRLHYTQKTELGLRHEGQLAYCMKGFSCSFRNSN